MKTIALLARKGGAGKTTLAVHLAALAASEGHRAMLLDVDDQESATDWWRVRDRESPELIQAGERKLSEAVRAAADDGVEVLVIDSPPHVRSTARAAAVAADMALIPCRPGPLDVRAVGATAELVSDLGRRGAFVINQAPPPRGASGEPSIVVEARRALEQYGLPVSPVAIAQRVALSHALIDGRSVTEYDEGGKAAEELTRLWRWIDG